MEVKAVKAFVQEQLGMDEMPYSMLDCLMTTICTDRTLPEPLNDYDGSLGPTPQNEASAQNENMFERIANFVSHVLGLVLYCSLAILSYAHCCMLHKRLPKIIRLHTSTMMQLGLS